MKLKELRKMNILDTAPEVVFDQLALLASSNVGARQTLR
jgi:hypothetical protein